MGVSSSQPSIKSGTSRDKQHNWTRITSRIPNEKSCLIKSTTFSIVSPSQRYVLHIWSKCGLDLFITDLFSSKIHQYNTEALSMIELMEIAHVHFVDEKTLVVRMYDNEGDCVHEHFVDLNHQTKKLLPKFSYYHQISEMEVAKDFRLGNLRIGRENYTLIYSNDESETQLLSQNPFHQNEQAIGRKIKWEEFQLCGMYQTKKGYAHTFGSKIFFFLFEIGEFGEEPKSMYLWKLACVDLAKHDLTKGDILIDANCDITIMDLRKTNFEEDVADISKTTDRIDEHAFHWIEDSKNGYVMNVEKLTVSKIYFELEPENDFVYYNDSLMLLRSTSGSDASETTMEYKIINYTVPKLKELCRNYIISNRLQKNLPKRAIKVLFPQCFE